MPLKLEINGLKFLHILGFIENFHQPRVRFSNGFYVRRDRVSDGMFTTRRRVVKKYQKNKNLKIFN
jgi:hypothetical protein